MDSSLMMGLDARSPYSSSSGVLSSNPALASRARDTEQRFTALIDGIRAATDDGTSSSSSEKKSSSSFGLSSSAITSDPRLPGDFISSFKIENPSVNDHAAKPVGAAANAGFKGSVDKTSKLYEQALELESFFVKMMLSSMRNTVQKSELSGDSGFAGKMYEDMLYDELSRDMTRGAGFGLADQVYLQLTGQNQNSML